MPSAPASSRRRSILIVLVAVIAIAALVVGGLLWRDRFGSGEQEAQELAAALDAGEVPPGADAEMHERILGPLLEVGAVPEVVLADPGRAEDGTRTATLAWTWTLPDDAGTWEYTTSATLRRGEDGWGPDLDPAAYAPDLAASEHLELATLDPELGSITDRDGTVLFSERPRITLRPRETPLLAPPDPELGSLTDRDGTVLFSERPVITLGLDKTQLAEDELDPAARELAGLLGIDPDRYAESVADHGPDAFVAALTIR